MAIPFLGMKNFAQTAGKQTKEIELLLEISCTNFSMAFSLLMRLAELEENDTEPQEGDEALERDALLLIPHCAHKLYKAKSKLFEPKISTSSSNIVGRNDPCPCGSGKKYKQCHGKLT